MGTIERNEDGSVTVHFIGMLANADSTVMGIGLDHDLMIQSLPVDDMIGLLASIEDLPDPGPMRTLLFDHCCIDLRSEKTYFVEGSFSVEGPDHLPALEAISRFDHAVINEYLDPVLSLIRLYTAGNLCSPLRYYYVMDEAGRARSRGWLGERFPVSREPFNIPPNQVRDLEDFIKANMRRRVEPFVKEAIDLYDHSFKPGPRAISFTVLLKALGTLLGSKSREERGFDFTRNLAILLGKDRKRSENIHRDSKELVAKEFHQMREGGKEIVTPKDVLKARIYTREAIKEVLEMEMSKPDMVMILGSCGYGERPWRAQEYS